MTVLILFIHGLEDQIVPYQHSKMLYQKANAPKELYLVERVAHILTLEEIAVQQKILQFINQTLDQSAMDLGEGLKMKEYLSNE
ncbi:alpha/beta hydrolase [Ignatzschineria rhizosphaerae]|uniref:Alpha/beta hydrolase n=1 Tax=Ignatzschineria rhizosphaerae TaxID=2923279 RepID=A0ABY3X6I8_9GAMM|nr:alpha/beta hydrolase [Ignatzschineria rhizosphaerae]UNM95613.1 alpha/beta hydrolase [Ignatzschineria rhizosphaerae]